MLVVSNNCGAVHIRKVIIPIINPNDSDIIDVRNFE